MRACKRYIYIARASEKGVTSSRKSNNSRTRMIIRRQSVYHRIIEDDRTRGLQLTTMRIITASARAFGPSSSPPPLSLRRLQRTRSELSSRWDNLGFREDWPAASKSRAVTGIRLQRHASYSTPCSVDVTCARFLFPVAVFQLQRRAHDESTRNYRRYQRLVRSSLPLISRSCRPFFLLELRNTDRRACSSGIPAVGPRYGRSPSKSKRWFVLSFFDAEHVKIRIIPNPPSSTSRVHHPPR